MRFSALRSLAPLAALSLLPAIADAQACLGLHAARRVASAEVVSNFLRDGVTGPSTLGLSLTAGGASGLFASVETGADPVAGKSAVVGNGIGGTVGIGPTIGPLSLCIGAAASQQESVGISTTASRAAFGGVALRLPTILGVRFSAFGVATSETRTTEPVGLDPIKIQGVAYRAGLAAAVRPWLGLRVYQDRFDDDHRVGFSVGLTAPLRREGTRPAPTSRPVVPSRPEPTVTATSPARVTTDSAPAARPMGEPVVARPTALDVDGDLVPDARDLCPNTPAGTPVGPTGCAREGDADGDLVPDGADQCPNTPAGALVNATGCPLDSDGDKVPDGIDQCPNTPVGTPVGPTGCPLPGRAVPAPAPAPAPVPVPTPVAAPVPNPAPAPPPAEPQGGAIADLFSTDASFTLTGLTFETGSRVIRPSSFPRLDEVAEALRANPEIRVEISGHTDDVGSPDVNLRLSQGRAEAVRNYFIEKGVAADRMTARGFGGGRPVTTSRTPEGREMNRRVEMTRIP